MSVGECRTENGVDIALNSDTLVTHSELFAFDTVTSSSSAAPSLGKHELARSEHGGFTSAWSVWDGVEPSLVSAGSVVGDVLNNCCDASENIRRTFQDEDDEHDSDDEKRMIIYETEDEGLLLEVDFSSSSTTAVTTTTELDLAEPSHHDVGFKIDFSDSFQKQTGNGCYGRSACMIDAERPNSVFHDQDTTAAVNQSFNSNQFMTSSCKETNRTGDECSQLDDVTKSSASTNNCWNGRDQLFQYPTSTAINSNVGFEANFGNGQQSVDNQQQLNTSWSSANLFEDVEEPWTSTASWHQPRFNSSDTGTYANYPSAKWSCGMWPSYYGSGSGTPAVGAQVQVSSGASMNKWHPWSTTQGELSSSSISYPPREQQNDSFNCVIRQWMLDDNNTTSPHLDVTAKPVATTGWTQPFHFHHQQQQQQQHTFLLQQHHSASRYVCAPSLTSATLNYFGYQNQGCDTAINSGYYGVGQQPTLGSTMDNGKMQQMYRPAVAATTCTILPVFEEGFGVSGRHGGGYRNDDLVANGTMMSSAGLAPIDKTNLRFGSTFCLPKVEDAGFPKSTMGDMLYCESQCNTVQPYHQLWLTAAAASSSQEKLNAPVTAETASYRSPIPTVHNNSFWIGSGRSILKSSQLGGSLLGYSDPGSAGLRPARHSKFNQMPYQRPYPSVHNTTTITTQSSNGQPTMISNAALARSAENNGVLDSGTGSLASSFKVYQNPLPQLVKSVEGTASASRAAQRRVPPAAYPKDSSAFIAMLPAMTAPTAAAEETVENDVTVTSHPGAAIETVFSKLPCVYDVRLKLCNLSLWKQFHACTNEMIITKTGRRLFPGLQIALMGLCPTKSYMVFVDFIQVGQYQWKYHSLRWITNGKAQSQPFVKPRRVYGHPDGTKLGSHWMSKAVVFSRLKLTNDMFCTDDQAIQLQSMHRYLPRISVVEVETLSPTGVVTRQVYSHAFRETEFVAVTAYQNTDITQLKIDHNPFAKGFREESNHVMTFSDTPNTINQNALNPGN